MRLIESVEVYYFRSSFRLSLDRCSDLTILAGKNDAGKSNILKALNLFFNNQTDYRKGFDFESDFSYVRRNEIRDRIKSRQFIRISVTFNRPDTFKTLPEQFTVTRTWSRDSRTPTETSNCVERMKEYSQASYSKFLASLQYIYVPAIKDRGVFEDVLSRLQEIMLDARAVQKNGIADQILGLNSSIVHLLEGVNQEFHDATGISSSVGLPTEINELYRAMMIVTNHGPSGEFLVPLDKRGDGIRVRYLPSILHYIACNSTKRYIWGFEEPENSLEHSLAAEMADSFHRLYSTRAQILVTSHSPAFFLPPDESVSVFRILQEELRTSVIPLREYEALYDDVGILAIQREANNRIAELLRRSEEESKNAARIQEYLRNMGKPLVLTEGKTDAQILNAAWGKLYGSTECPYRIESCNLMADENSTSVAGSGVLRKILESYRESSPCIVVGIFDVDGEGRKCLGLDRNYSSWQGRDDIKVHRNRKAFGMLWPVPEFRIEYARRDNFLVEFFFSDEALNKRVGGLGLELMPYVTYHKVRNQSRQVTSTEPEDRLIVESTKAYFAEHVVPSLPRDEFRGFEPVFVTLNAILAAAQTALEAALHQRP